MPRLPAAASSRALFDCLLDDIVGGRHPVGANLPPERELARTLGASRPTLREALRRLGEWGLIEARRGSGVVVRPMNEWSLEVLPAFLRHALSSGAGAPALSSSRRPPALPRDGLPALVLDLLSLRRALVVDVLLVIGHRFSPGSLAPARAAVERAWAARGDVAEFVREDLAALRAVVEAAQFLPALWTLNGFAGVYAEIAATLTGAARIPGDYRRSLAAVFDALEQGRTEPACRALAAYLERHDRKLTLSLGIAP